MNWAWVQACAGACAGICVSVYAHVCVRGYIEVNFVEEKGKQKVGVQIKYKNNFLHTKIKAKNGEINIVILAEKK